MPDFAQPLARLLALHCWRNEMCELHRALYEGHLTSACTNDGRAAARDIHGALANSSSERKPHKVAVVSFACLQMTYHIRRKVQRWEDAVPMCGELDKAACRTASVRWSAGCLVPAQLLQC